MSIASAILVFVLFLGGACSTTQGIARPATFESFAAATQTGGGRVDVIVAPEPDDPEDGGRAQSPAPFQSPPRVAARLLNVGGEGITIAGRHAPRTVSLDNVSGYDVTSRGKGAVEGLGLGLLGGITLGALAGFVAGDDPPCDPNQMFGCVLHYTAGDKALIGGVLGGVTGALGGLIIGALIGHTDHYVF